eukprot:CAMPEP_0172073424 /NCGR_PEP_ID=MMETSP1043-20130122/14846_1 /TAXON_ID=464988 /ORGANISM="Hemiselmis andersenii, Strain CCMP441" /LENGTH=365 /DNA_ID=CAMNT_0012733967 /DNA_START=382 /DNA_END=1477 /DNA_ORIENTATION=-
MERHGTQQSFEAEHAEPTHLTPPHNHNSPSALLRLVPRQAPAPAVHAVKRGALEALALDAARRAHPAERPALMRLEVHRRLGGRLPQQQPRSPAHAGGPRRAVHREGGAAAGGPHRGADRGVERGADGCVVLFSRRGDGSHWRGFPLNLLARRGPWGALFELERMRADPRGEVKEEVAANDGDRGAEFGRHSFSESSPPDGDPPPALLGVTDSRPQGSCSPPLMVMVGRQGRDVPFVEGMELPFLQGGGVMRPSLGDDGSVSDVELGESELLWLLWGRPFWTRGGRSLLIAVFSGVMLLHEDIVEGGRVMMGGAPSVSILWRAPQAGGAGWGVVVSLCAGPSLPDPRASSLSLAPNRNPLIAPFA